MTGGLDPFDAMDALVVRDAACTRAVAAKDGWIRGGEVWGLVSDTLSDRQSDWPRSRGPSERECR